MDGIALAQLPVGLEGIPVDGGRIQVGSGAMSGESPESAGAGRKKPHAPAAK